MPFLFFSFSFLSRQLLFIYLFFVTLWCFFFFFFQDVTERNTTLTVRLTYGQTAEKVLAEKKKIPKWSVIQIRFGQFFVPTRKSAQLQRRVGSRRAVNFTWPSHLPKNLKVKKPELTFPMVDCFCFCFNIAIISEDKRNIFVFVF